MLLLKIQNCPPLCLMIPIRNKIYLHSSACNWLTLDSETIGSVLPLQVRPSPVNPGLHLQRYDPFVLLHIASALQLDVPSTHSFTSVKFNGNQFNRENPYTHDQFYHFKGWSLNFQFPFPCSLNKIRASVTFTFASPSISRISRFTWTVIRTIGIVANSIFTAALCSWSTLIDIWK